MLVRFRLDLLPPPWANVLFEWSLFIFSLLPSKDFMKFCYSELELQNVPFTLVPLSIFFTWVLSGMPSSAAKRGSKIWLRYSYVIYCPILLKYSKVVKVFNLMSFLRKFLWKFCVPSYREGRLLFSIWEINQCLEKD